MPAPEALVEAFVRERCRDFRGDLRPLLEEVAARVTIQADAVEVQLFKPAQNKGDQGEAQIVMLPWTKKPFRAAKGVAPAPVATAGMDPKAWEALLAAIGRARRWADELTAGQTVAAIAKKEGKGQRQVRLLLPLAYLSPSELSQIASGRARLHTITDLAKDVPLSWG